MPLLINSDGASHTDDGVRHRSRSFGMHHGPSSSSSRQHKAGPAVAQPAPPPHPHHHRHIEGHHFHGRQAAGLRSIPRVAGVPLLPSRRRLLKKPKVPVAVVDNLSDLEEDLPHPRRVSGVCFAQVWCCGGCSSCCSSCCSSPHSRCCLCMYLKPGRGVGKAKHRCNSCVLITHTLE